MPRTDEDLKVSREVLTRALHDLQAPARHVRSFLSMFRDSVDSTKLTSDSKELLEAASRAADELRDRITAIRSVLSIPCRMNAVVSVDLESVIRQIWERVSQTSEKDDDESRLVIEGGGEVSSDEKLIGDLVSELLENSLRFKKADSPLVIQCRINGNQDSMRIEITDNGVGIEPERIDWMMQPFHVGQHRGVVGPGDGYGLGLTRCHCIASTIGCRLSLRSDGSTGTTAVMQFRS